MTEVLKINPAAPEPEILARAGDILRAGGLVAYPTETVYGLAASAFVVDSVARVFDAKQRPYSQAAAGADRRHRRSGDPRPRRPARSRGDCWPISSPAP